jgi:hypothetical protein
VGIYLSRSRAGLRPAGLIVDLSGTGRSPSNEDGSVDRRRRVYNHASSGHLLAKATSTAMATPGRCRTCTGARTGCVHHPRGVFAFAIWNGQIGRLFRP